MLAIMPDSTTESLFDNLNAAQEDQTPIEDDAENEEVPIRYTISSYGADYDVEGLVRRIQREDVRIPDFQRRYVWTLKQASKFIESLILGLPVPGIFVSKERGTQKLLVIDGQQRLTSLKYFIEGTFGPKNVLFALTDLAENSRLAGRTYKTLRDEDRRELDNAIIHATVVKQDEPDDDDSGIYQIFERLNTGGTILQPQEIRSAINFGKFSKFLRELNKDEAWRSLVGPVNKNLRDEELILRFFALYYSRDQYAKPMLTFLNKYMKVHSNLSDDEEREMSRVFKQAVSVIAAYLGTKAFKPVRALRAALVDAVTVGVAKRLEGGVITDDAAFRQAYESLLANAEFGGFTSKGTSDEEAVRGRINLAIDAFSKVP